MREKTKPTEAAVEFIRASKRRDESARDMERARIEHDRAEMNLVEAEKALILSVDEQAPLRVFETRPDRAAHEHDPSVVVVQWTPKGVTITVTKPETASR